MYPALRPFLWKSVPELLILNRPRMRSVAATCCLVKSLNPSKERASSESARRCQALSGFSRWKCPEWRRTHSISGKIPLVWAQAHCIQISTSAAQEAVAWAYYLNRIFIMQRELSVVVPITICVSTGLFWLGYCLIAQQSVEHSYVEPWPPELFYSHSDLPTTDQLERLLQLYTV